jgi:hypothetical protein
MTAKLVEFEASIGQADRGRDSAEAKLIEFEAEAARAVAATEV